MWPVSKTPSAAPPKTPPGDVLLRISASVVQTKTAARGAFALQTEPVSSAAKTPTVKTNSSQYVEKAAANSAKAALPGSAPHAVLRPVAKAPKAAIQMGSGVPAKASQARSAAKIKSAVGIVVHAPQAPRSASIAASIFRATPSTAVPVTMRAPAVCAALVASASKTAPSKSLIRVVTPA